MKQEEGGGGVVVVLRIKNQPLPTKRFGEDQDGATPSRMTEKMKERMTLDRRMRRENSPAVVEGGVVVVVVAEIAKMAMQQRTKIQWTPTIR